MSVFLCRVAGVEGTVMETRGRLDALRWEQEIYFPECIKQPH